MRDRICIILHNLRGNALGTLASLSKIDYKLLTTIVVDQASTKESVHEIRSAFPRTPIFESRENVGVAEGNNIGIRWILGKPFKWILLLANNTTVSPDLLRAFMQTAKAFPDGKIFGAKIYTEASEIDSLAYQESSLVDFVSGSALLFHREVAETIGLLDPRFFLYWEDIDYCFRARRRGFIVRTAPLAKVWQKSPSAQNDYYWWRGRLLWLKRNLPPKERQQVMRKKIWPELIGLTRQGLLTPGLLGALDYFLGRFSLKK